MSTIAYAVATARAQQHPEVARVTGVDEQPSSSKASELAQKLAAVVPVEVIAAWGAVLAKTTDKAAGGTVILKPDGGDTQKLFLLVLAGLSILIYLGAKLLKAPHKFGGLDFVRMLIPPVAFVVWTELTGSTALGLWAPFSKVSELVLWGWALVIGIVLLFIQGVLTPKTDPDGFAGGMRAEAAGLRPEG